MELKKFNMITSMSAFLIGTVYIFSDGAGITANVIGASGTSAGISAVIGLFMIIFAMGLFIVSRDNTDHRSIDLERLIRGTKDHKDLNSNHTIQSTEEEYTQRP